MASLYHTEDCPKILVGEREGGMVEILVEDDHAVFIPAAQARGLAMKLILVAMLADK